MIIEEFEQMLMKDAEWCNFIGVNDIDGLNRLIREGKAVHLVNLCEAKHESNIAQIASAIAESNSRCVFIAGPSSSGKTSSSLRISLQCKVHGLTPNTIELDNYFLDRDKTPLGEDGKPDYECLGAMDLSLLNEQLNDLADGKEVKLPTFNFITGKKEFRGNTLKLGPRDILIMEGIHALDPALTPDIPDFYKFNVYVSDVSSLCDYTPSLHLTDSRLLRRICRDARTRGSSAERTIITWPSVRSGEEKYIYPTQKYANASFNSTSQYQLPLFKNCSMHLLHGIHEDSPAYEKAQSLIAALDMVEALPIDAVNAIPCTSIMREFIGGQILTRDLD